MKKHAELCPVCKGSGKYKDYSYSNYSANIYIEKVCHGCGGIGWVSVIDEETLEDTLNINSTIIFSDTETDMNRYYEEFCKDKGIDYEDFNSSNDNHIPHID